MPRLARIFDRVATAWLFFWASLIAVYAHAGGLAFAGLAIILGLAGWLVWLLRARDVPLLSRDVLICMAAFAAFFLWLGITGSWSGAGPETAVRLAVLMAALVGVPVLMLHQSDWTQVRLSHIFMVTALGGAAILLFDVLSGFAISIGIDPEGTRSGDGSLPFRQNEAEMTVGRAHVTWAILTPLIVTLFWTRLSRRAALIAGAVLVALLIAGSLANRLSIVTLILIGTAPVLYLGYRSPIWGLRLSLGTLVLSILLAPLLGILARLGGESLMERLPGSWDHRLRMWDFSWQLIQERPLLGHGLDISRTIDDSFTTRTGLDWPIISLHPHNIGIQTWLEAGAIGGVLLSLALATLYTPLRRLVGDDAYRGAAVAGTVMAAAIGSAITVGAWQFWWWGLIGFALIWATLVPVRKLVLL